MAKTTRIVMINDGPRHHMPLMRQDEIEYYSKTTKSWVPAVVVKVITTPENTTYYQLVRSADHASRKIRADKTPTRLIRRAKP